MRYTLHLVVSRSMRLRLIAMTILISVAGSAWSAAASYGSNSRGTRIADEPKFDIAKKSFTLVLNTDNDRVTLEVSPSSIDKSKLTFKEKDNKGIATFDPQTLVVTAKTIGNTELTIAYSGDNPVTTQTVSVIVERRVKEIDLINPALQSGESLVLIQGREQPVEVLLRDRDKKEIKDATVRLTSDTKSVEVTKKDGKDILVAKSKGTATVKILAADKTGLEPGPEPKREIKVEVKEAIREIVVTPNQINAREAQEYPLSIELKGVDEGNYRVPARPFKWISSNTALVEVLPDGKLKVNVSPVELSAKERVTVTIYSDEGIAGTEPKTTVIVVVYPRGGSITFEAQTSIVNPGGGNTTIKAIVHDKNGTPNPSKTVTWSLVDETTANNYIALSAQGNTVTVTGLDKPEELPPAAAGSKPPKRATSFKIRATYQPPGEQPIVGEFLIRVVEGTTFSPLNVKLAIMDDQTAADLYGKVTANEYFITQVRIYNNLKNESNGKFIGASILAFSASIEVSVALEKKFDRKSGSVVANGRDDDKWQPLTDADLKGIMQPVGNGTSGNLPVDPPFKDLPCQSTTTYRPYTFEMMVNTVDRRDERSLRSRIFQGLNSAGTVFSFVTAVAQPGPNSDLPLGLEKYSNLFIPGLEKLWPSLKEAHRQNIVSQTMKTIEEVPFGSDLSRVLFLPKKPFRGLLQGRLVRISQICPYFFRVEVAVIEKGGKSTVTQGAPPQ
ncbi:MAG: hypothetical protein AABO41_02020 [Acidobacteriota bacterium]